MAQKMIPSLSFWQVTTIALQKATIASETDKLHSRTGEASDGPFAMDKADLEGRESFSGR